MKPATRCKNEIQNSVWNPKTATSGCTPLLTTCPVHAPPLYKDFMTSLAASMVLSISSSVCAKDVKPASYELGAR